MDFCGIRVSDFFLVIYEDGDSEEYTWPALKNVSDAVYILLTNLCM
jgi:hypothetical protein